MSMEDPASSHDGQDTEMSDAAMDDPELALGKVICFRFTFTDSLFMMCTFYSLISWFSFAFKKLVEGIGDC